MKTIKGSRGVEQPFFTDAEMDRIAVEELMRVELLPSRPEPVRIDRFIEKRFNCQICYEDLPAGVLGYTRFGLKGVEAVYVSRSLADDCRRVAERRHTSTLAHEAGHGLLHAYLFMLDSFPRTLFESDKDVTPMKILCRDGPVTRGGRYDGRWWEYQANRMIGALLLPKPLVLSAIGRYLSPNGQLATPTLRDDQRGQVARDLAELFDVNGQVAEIRLSGLCPRVSTEQLTL